MTKFVACCDRNLVGVLFVFDFPLYLFNFVLPSGLGMLSLSLSLSLSLFVLDLIPQLTLINIQNPNYDLFNLNNIQTLNIQNPKLFDIN
jgi:hypothetical protein